MKRVVSEKIDRAIDLVCRKIRKGELKIDRGKYEQQRADRLLEGANKKAMRRAMKKEEQRRIKMVEEAEFEAMEKYRLQDQLKKNKAAREEAMRQRLKRRREERLAHKEAIRKAKAVVQRHRKAKPLHKRWEKKYEEKFVLPEIEQRKQALEKIREEKRKPLNVKEIIENEKRYKIEHERNLYKSKLEVQNVVARRNTKMKGYYRGKSHLIAQEEDLAYRSRMKEEKMRSMLERKSRYSNLIREMFSPSVDLSKRHEIERKKDEIKEKEKFLKMARDRKKDLNSRDWRIEDEDIRRQERRRLRAKRKKAKREEEDRKRNAKSAPDYMALCIKRGKKKNKKTPPKRPKLQDYSTLEKNVRKMERATRERHKALRSSAEGLNDVDAVEEETEMYIRLAKEKMKLLKRVGQQSR